MNYLEILDQLPKLRVYKDKEYNLNISYRFQKFDNELPILFLHGFNGNSKSWAYQFMYFKNKRSVIAIDTPGFGKSDAADLSMFNIAELVNNLLTRIGIKQLLIGVLPQRWA